MRAIWKGAIAFGLVNVPVKVYSATEDHDISLHQVHNADGGRIRYQRRCEVCSKVVDYEDIDKAYEDDGRTVVLSREELKSIPAENSHEIEVVQFVPAEQLDPIMFEKSYYLEPDSKSPKAYVLLRRALEDTDRVAIVQFALREKTRLGALRIRDDVLVLQSLLWADEVREASFPALEAVRPDLRPGAGDVRRAGGLHGRRLRARTVHRRLPGPAAPADRGQAGEGRVAGHRGDLRRRGRRSRQRRGDRPDGGAEAEPGKEARGRGIVRRGRARGAADQARRKTGGETGGRQDRCENRPEDPSEGRSQGRVEDRPQGGPQSRCQEHPQGGLRLRRAILAGRRHRDQEFLHARHGDLLRPGPKLRPPQEVLPIPS